MFPYRKKDKRGLTLIEVIVSLAILGLVLTMAYSLMGFTRTALSDSNDQFDIQNDIRLASSYVSDQVRFATELKIMSYSDAAAEIAAHTAYNYFYIDGGALYQAKYIDSTTYEEHTYARSLSSADSHFNAVGTSPLTTLNITLAAEQDGKDYDVSTDIKLENFPIISHTLAIQGTGPDLAIRYKIPPTTPTPIPTPTPTPTPPVLLGSSPLPDAEKNTNYSYTFQVNGTSPPYTFSVTNGALPKGLNLSSSGLLSGKPNGSSGGDYTFIITVTDASGMTDSKTFQLTVNN